jgi:hypothetical protein
LQLEDKLQVLLAKKEIIQLSMEELRRSSSCLSHVTSIIQPDAANLGTDGHSEGE